VARSVGRRKKGLRPSFWARLRGGGLEDEVVDGAALRVPDEDIGHALRF
jgi:hypothetical protein